MEGQGKALIQQRAELEAAAQARQQELGALQLEVKRLREELREWELEKDIEESCLTRSGVSLQSSPHMVRKKNTSVFSRLSTVNLTQTISGNIVHLLVFMSEWLFFVSTSVLSSSI